MPETLPVHLNRETIHDVEAPASFEAPGTFSVVVENHGSDSHVHLHLDDDLSRIARIDAGNHYVEGGTTRSVSIEVADGASGTGYLDVVTGYGAQRESVAVTIDPEGSETVTVDEDLGTPQREPVDREAASSDSGWAIDEVTAPASIVAIAAVVLAVVIAVSSDIGALIVGGLAIVLGVAVAAYYILTA
ncbi:MAG: hypothetical protein ABEJ57_04745 [Halobacteriaceae archaeon]